MAPCFRQVEPLLTFGLSPVPEKYDKTYKAKHYSEPEKIYAVNLFKVSCTCADSESRRLRFVDLRIVCKHILDKLKSVKLYQTYDSLTANLLHCSAYLGDDIFRRCEIDGTPYVLSSSQQSDWINVHLGFAPKRGSAVVRFGFNVQDRTWQYELPAKASELEKYIFSLL